MPLLKERLDGFLAMTAGFDSQILRVGAAHSVGTEHGITWRTRRNVTANLFDDPENS